MFLPFALPVGFEALDLSKVWSVGSMCDTHPTERRAVVSDQARSATTSARAGRGRLMGQESQ